MTRLIGFVLENDVEAAPNHHGKLALVSRHTVCCQCVEQPTRRDQRRVHVGRLRCRSDHIENLVLEGWVRKFGRARHVASRTHIRHGQLCPCRRRQHHQQNGNTHQHTERSNHREPPHVWCARSAAVGLRQIVAGLAQPASARATAAPEACTSVSARSVAAATSSR